MLNCRCVIESIVFVGLALVLPCQSAQCADDAAFPSQPIRIVVYMGPGGLIDVTARKFSEVAAKYCDATFVVENKPGAGGLVAMKQVLQLPADGYTLLACTKSNISSIVATGRESYLDQFAWIAMLMADPECIIIRRDTGLNSWDAVVADCRAKQGRQIWVGPDIGGLDHVMALKTWDRFGLAAKWIPFESGGAAVTALLGDQGVAYVGNPRDTLGNPDQLKIAVVSSPKPLDVLPDAPPTFKDYGFEDLDHESMWRGFAVKADTPPRALAWYDKLFEQVANDPSWRAFWEKGGIDVEYRGADEFTAVVKNDAKEFAFYLNKIGLVQSRADQGFARLFQGTGAVWAAVVLLVANGLLAVGLIAFGHGQRLGSYMIPAFVISISLLFAAMTLAFPRIDEVGASAVPRLWTCILIPLGVCLLLTAFKDRVAPSRGPTRTDLVWKFSLLVAAYVAAVAYFGYFLSSFVFLFVSMHALGVRRLAVKILVPAAWLLASYWVFVRMLFIPLPT